MLLVGDERDEFHARAAPRAFQNIDGERSFEELLPNRDNKCRARKAQGGWLHELRARLGLWPDPRTPRAGGRQDAAYLTV